MKSRLKNVCPSAVSLILALAMMTSFAGCGKKSAAGKTAGKTAAYAAAQEAGRRKFCTNNLKQIGNGLEFYKLGTNDEFPKAAGTDGLQLLRDGGHLTDEKVYRCPAAKDSGFSYVYYADGLILRSANAGQLPVVICYSHDMKFMNVLFADGHVKGFELTDDLPTHEERVKFVLGKNTRSREAQIILQNARKLDLR